MDAAGGFRNHESARGTDAFRGDVTASGSDHGPAPARAAGWAGASSPAPAQRLGERPVVRDQARHPSGVVLDLPLQGRDLRGVLRPLPLVLRGQLPQGSRQLPF